MDLMALLVSERYFYLSTVTLLSVEFVSGDIARSLVNTLVEVGDCELHCSQPWESLTSQPVPHQILLESRLVLIIILTTVSKLNICPGTCPTSGRGT